MFVFISMPSVLNFNVMTYKKHIDLLICFMKRKIIQWLYMLIMKYILNSYTLNVKANSGERFRNKDTLLWLQMKKWSFI